jgi:hypothetical protein
MKCGKINYEQVIKVFIKLITKRLSAVKMVWHLLTDDMSSLVIMKYFPRLKRLDLLMVLLRYSCQAKLIFACFGYMRSYGSHTLHLI